LNLGRSETNSFGVRVLGGIGPEPIPGATLDRAEGSSRFVAHERGSEPVAGDLHGVASGSRPPKPGAGSSAGRAGSGKVMVMGVQQERIARIAALRGLIGRLCAPDLPLAEAEVLRARLSDLLEVDKEPAACDQLAASPALVP